MSSFTNIADARLDISVSVFGIASVQLEVQETPIQGTGTMAITHEGKYQGKVHYNSLETMTDNKYQVECSSETGRLELKFFQPPDLQPKLAFYSSYPQTGAGKFYGVMHFN